MVRCTFLKTYFGYCVQSQLQAHRDGSREISGETTTVVQLEVILACTRETVVEFVRSNQVV